MIKGVPEFKKNTGGRFFSNWHLDKINMKDNLNTHIWDNSK